MTEVVGDRPTPPLPPPPARVPHPRRRRVADAVDERLGIKVIQYPVPAHANTVAYSLGGLTAFALVILVGSGVIIAQFYNPDPALRMRPSGTSCRTCTPAGSFASVLLLAISATLLVRVLRHVFGAAPGSTDDRGPTTGPSALTEDRPQ